MHWWAELWDNWAKTFGYDHWEWGSASDAFAAIGTVGALAVTLHIVRKDRRDKTEELARAVVGWYEVEQRSMKEDGKLKSWIDIKVDVHNSSTRPVTGVRAYFMADRVGLPLRAPGGEKNYATLLPGQGGTFKRSAPGLTPKDVTTVIVVFYDANGVSWTRNLKSQEILPNHESWLQRRLSYWSWILRTGNGRWNKNED